MPNQCMILDVYVHDSSVEHTKKRLLAQASDDILFINHIEKGKIVTYLAFKDFNSLGTGVDTLIQVKAKDVHSIEKVWVTYLEGIDHIKQLSI